jgi:P4 family phage/plasmid primase-like protien
MDWLARHFEHTEGAVELRAFPNARDGGRAPSIFTRDAEDVARFVKAWDRPGYGVYFGACTRRADSTPPGRLETVAECPALWIDKDDGRDVDLLTGCYLPASVVVDSGRGLHGWWLLDEAVDVSRGRGEAVLGALRELRRVFASDPSVCDLARVMRLPGTHNSKGDEPREVRILHDSGRRYSFDDIRDWLAWQQPLSGDRPDPFLAAAEKLGVKPALDVEQALATMGAGNIHDRQLRISASLRTAGRPEDEIVASLLQATRLAMGEASRGWDWRKEEHALREMVRGAERKFGQVVKLDQRRRTVNGGDGGGSGDKAEAGEGEPTAGRVARIAAEAWGRPIITVDAEMWTYEGGAWRRMDEGQKHDLTTHVHGAARLVGKTSSAVLNGAFRWIHEDPSRVRRGVRWDAVPVVVGTNGALDLSTGGLVPHSQEHYATRSVACAIDSAARCPKWLQFFRDALPEDTDAAIGTLQEWFGAALVKGKPRELRKGLMIYGPSYTGKTQVAKIARALLGGNTCGLMVKAMAENFGMEPLLHASGWIADDAVGPNEALDSEAYKHAVTGESLRINRKHQSQIEAEIDLPVLLTMNTFPIVKDNSDAVFNRTLVLAMRTVRSEQTASRREIAEIIKEEELAGVLNWAAEGWRRLRDRGWFDPPPVMIASGKEFKGQNNPWKDFADLCLEENEDKMIMRSDLVKIFNAWARQEFASRDWSGKAIANLLRANMPNVVGDKVHDGATWVGVAFKQPAIKLWPSIIPGVSEKSLSDLNHGLTNDVRERIGRPIRPAMATRF